jgi:hypothetical protein
MKNVHRLVLSAVLVMFAVACVYAIPKDAGLPLTSGAPVKGGAAKPAGDAAVKPAASSTGSDAIDPARPAAASTDSSKPKDPAAERAAKAEAAKKALDQARLKRALMAQRTSLTLEHTTVKDILKMLSEMGRFSVVFDPELESAGIDLSTRTVSLTFTGLKYEDALMLVLPRECGYRVGPGYILVTTLEKSWLPLKTATYSVHQALAEVPNFEAPRMDMAAFTQQAAAAAQGGGGGGGIFGQPRQPEKEAAATPDRIIEIIKKFVRNDNDRRIAPWDDEGGPASITFLNGNLVISQTDQGHRAVAELLARLF